MKTRFLPPLRKIHHKLLKIYLYVIFKIQRPSLLWKEGREEGMNERRKKGSKVLIFIENFCVPGFAYDE